MQKSSAIIVALLSSGCIASLLAQSGPTDNELKLLPPYEEIPPSFWEQHGTQVLIGICLLIVVAAVAIWFACRPKPPVIVPPEIQVQRSLEALRQRLEDAKLSSEVSQILRHYVAAVFDLPPGELTTSEFKRAVKDHPQIGADLASNLVQFLRGCDEFKFAPAGPPEMPGMVLRATKLVELCEARRAWLRDNSTATPPPLSKSA